MNIKKKITTKNKRIIRLDNFYINFEENRKNGPVPIENLMCIFNDFLLLVYTKEGNDVIKKK